MRNTVICGMAALGLAACASSSADVAPSYVSALQYRDHSCDQLRLEAQRMSAHAAQAAGVQDSRRSSDKVMTAVAVVVFWPAVFAIGGDNAQTAELARLKGEMQAIEGASIEKNCGIVFQKEPPPQPVNASAQRPMPRSR